MPLSKIKSMTSGLDIIAQTIAVPNQHRPARLPSFPNLERTATVSTMATTTLPVTGGHYRDITVLRNPVYPMWTTSTASTGAASLFYKNSSASGYLGRITTSGEEIKLPDDYMDYHGAAGADTTWVKAMARRYPVVESRGKTFVLSGANCLRGVTLTFSGTLTTTLGFEFEVLDGRGETSTFQATQAVSSNIVSYVSANNLGGGFFRLSRIWAADVVSASADLVLVQVGVCSAGNINTPTGSGLTVYAPLFAPPEFTNSTLPYASVRCNAAALLMSNVTAVLDKEGTVSAARVPLVQSVHPFAGAYGTTSNFTSAISSVYPKDRYFGPLEKGLYVFTMPDASSERFHDCVADTTWDVSNQGDGLAMPRFFLDSIDYVQLITLSDLSGNGSTIAVTQDAHLEFRSSSMLFPVGYAAVPLETYHAAQMALANLGVFFENPVHLATIGALVRAAVSRVAPIVLPYVKQAAVAVGSHLLSGAAKTLSARMDQAGLTQPRPAPKSPARISASRKKAKAKSRPRK